MFVAVTSHCVNSEMNEDRYLKLKTTGHWTGIVCMVIGLLVSLKYEIRWAFFGGLFVYWVINYALIRWYIYSKYVRTQL